MNKEIAGDLRFFLAAVVLGIFAALVYDVLRGWRRFRPHSLFRISVQDFLYWFLLGLAGFRLIYSYNDGTLRAFVFFGMCLGAGLYAVTLGRLFVNCFLKLLLFFTFPLRKVLLFFGKQGKLRERIGSHADTKQRHHGRTDVHGKKKRKKKDRAEVAPVGSTGDVRSADLYQGEGGERGKGADGEEGFC